MVVLDAGSYNYREWWCKRCDRKDRVHHAEDPPTRYRRPCPTCSPGAEQKYPSEDA